MTKRLKKKKAFAKPETPCTYKKCRKCPVRGCYTGELVRAKGRSGWNLIESMFETSEIVKDM